MSNPVGWFEIYVKDMARARKFYEGVFETTLQRIGPPEGDDLQMWGWNGDQSSYGTPGALVKMKENPPGGFGTLVYFSCDDCAVQEARVAKFGGKVHRPKLSIGPYGFISLVVDTEGNMFGLHSMK
jgi:predicted enzyme related to lactoylglutathione lyase